MWNAESGTVCRAAWVLPISRPPLRDGWIRIASDRAAALGTGTAPAGPLIDLGSVAVLPGLINAHTHLEFSYLRGCIPPHVEFPQWIRAVLAGRAARPDPRDVEIVEPARRAIDEARRCGTAALADISNTLVTGELLTAAEMPSVLFHELIRFNRDAAEEFARAARESLTRLTADPRVRTNLAAHAPYSVSPDLFRAVRRDQEARPGSLCSVHLGESTDELTFLRTGGGALRALLEDLGAWDDRWQAPGCGPVEYLDQLGFLNPALLVVHGVHLTGEELRRLAAHGCTLVTCPRGNIRTGAGKPPVAAFFESGVAVAVGTDSLASVDDLNLFSELAEMRRLAPGVPARRLLESATLAGARALGFEEFGAIEPGRAAALIAVRVPSGVGDVEEYLVNGVAPDDVQWVTDPASASGRRSMDYV